MLSLAKFPKESYIDLSVREWVEWVKHAFPYNNIYQAVAPLPPFCFRKNPKQKIFFSFLKKIWARDIKKMQRKVCGRKAGRSGNSFQKFSWKKVRASS